MVILQRFVRRYHHAGWLLRYWVMDKYRERLRVLALMAATLVVVVLAVIVARGLHQDYTLVGEVRVVKSIINFWVQLIIMIVLALVAYALAPKPPQPEAQTSQAPVVEDGKSIIKVYGTVWIGDSIVLGWKQMGTDPIKKKGGKK